MVKSHPERMFVFGDNVARVGLGGQAKEMRGEPNSIGIVTKWLPSSNDQSYFYDFQFPAVKLLIEQDFRRLFDFPGTIVWPLDSIGRGLARLDVTSPLTLKYIEKLKGELEYYVQ